jgi:hypothetical protein
MPDQERWISLAVTIDRIMAALKCAVAAAQNVLISACAAGEIRSRHGAHHERQCPPLHKSDWIGADIELANDRVVKALGNHPIIKAERVGMKGVEFSEADLDAWIAGESTAQPAGSRDRHLTAMSARNFVRDYIEADPNPTLDGLRKHAAKSKIIGGRKFYEPEYRAQMKSKNDWPYRSGRRSNMKSAKI